MVSAKVFRPPACNKYQPKAPEEEFFVANSIIAEDQTIEGNIASGEGSVEIKGKVIGSVTAQSIIIHVSGSIDGALSAKSTVIDGRYKGKLKCDDLRLSSTATIQADITAQTMTVENGAEIEGNVQITGKH